MTLADDGSIPAAMLAAGLDGADIALTKAQAKAACDRLIKDGLKTRIRFAGKGGANPVAPNKNARGRAANRRLVITFTL